MKRFFLLTALFAAITLQAQESNPTQEACIWFDTPNTLNGRTSWYNSTDDHEWESRSLPIGNGSIGGNILGSIAAERITLNEKSLWMGGPNTAWGTTNYWDVNKQSAHLLPEIRQAFTAGNSPFLPRGKTDVLFCISAALKVISKSISTVPSSEWARIRALNLNLS